MDILQFTIAYEWQGGHPSGCVSYLNKSAWVVRFNDGTRKAFKSETYGYENAKKMAEEWRDKTSLEKGLTKNQYRVIECDVEGRYIEMKLQGDYTAKFDECDLDIATKHVWNAKKSYKTFYMTHSCRKNLKSQSFHRLIFPQFEEIDHINRDGLDNRRKNLRDGKKGLVNNKNKSQRVDNASGKTGVHFSNYYKQWVVQWPCDGKRLKRSFSANFYGYEKAKEMAIEFRKKCDSELGIYNGY